jgi:hypothetical protein
VEDKLITLPNDRGKSIQSATRFLTEPRVSYAAVEFDLWRFSVGRIFNLLVRLLCHKSFRGKAAAADSVSVLHSGAVRGQINFGTCGALINI